MSISSICWCCFASLLGMTNCFDSNQIFFIKPPWPPLLEMVLFLEPLITFLLSSTILPSKLKRILELIPYQSMGLIVLLELIRSLMNLFMVSRTTIRLRSRIMRKWWYRSIIGRFIWSSQEVFYFGNISSTNEPRDVSTTK